MLSSIVRFLIDPFNIFLFLTLACFFSSYLKKKRLFKWMLFTTLVWFLLITTPLLANTIIHSLEDQYSSLEISNLSNPDTTYHILILGAGHGYDEQLPAGSLLGESSLRRLTEGIRLHRQLPNSKLVLSGYSTVGGITGAEMQQKAALELGVQKESMLLQKEPINTYREAEVYAGKFGNTHPLILVTSAVHMPRAMTVFEYFGIVPIASPTDYQVTGSRGGQMDWISGACLY